MEMAGVEREEGMVETEEMEAGLVEAEVERGEKVAEMEETVVAERTVTNK